MALARMVVLIGVVATALVRLPTFVWLAADTFTAERMGDFSVFHHAAVVASRGGHPYGADSLKASNGGVIPNLNPPQFVLITRPLAALTPRSALAVWMAASLLSAVAALVLIARATSATPLAIGAMLLLVTCSAATGAFVVAMQVTWLLWGPLAWSWVAMRRGRWTSAAVIVGVLVSLKPFLLPLLFVFVAWRRWGALAAAMSSAALAYAVGIAAFGWDAFSGWLHGLGTITWAGQIFNASIYALWTRGFEGIATAVWPLAPVVVAPRAIVPLWALSSVVLLALSAWSLRHEAPPRREGAPDAATRAIDRAWLVLTAAALLVSPVGWIYYLFFLTGPVLAWWTTGDDRLTWPRVAMMAALALLMVSPDVLAGAQPHGWASVTLGSGYMWSLLLIWIAALPQR